MVPPGPSKPDVLSSGGVPFETVRAHRSIVNQFSRDLVARAKVHMRARGSQTLLTDTDLACARQEMLQRSSSSRVRRCMGDGALIAGGIFIPLWSTSPILSLAGVLVCALGLYIREWDGH
jgi:hypothetical protein